MSDPRLPKFQFPPTDANGESSLPFNEVLPDPRLFEPYELVDVLGILYHPVQKDGVWGWQSPVDGFVPWEPPKSVTQRMNRIKWGHKRPRTMEPGLIFEAEFTGDTDTFTWQPETPE